jgi:hypothetical protein
MTTLFIFLSRALFEWRGLNVKKLTDQGISAASALYYQRLALFPSLLLTALTFRIEYFQTIIHNYLFIIALLLSLPLWVTAEYISFYVLGSVQSLVFLTAFGSMIGIPIYLAIGIIINHDIPSVVVITAVISLLIAVLIKPAAIIQKKHGMFEKSPWFIACLIVFGTVCSGVNNALGRFLFTNLNGMLFLIGLTMTFSCLSAYLFVLLVKPPVPAIEHNTHLKLFAYSIPFIWFLASIPEGYGIKGAPIFTMAAISSITFLMDVASDLRNKRIVWGIRTAAFIVLVLVGVGAAAFSV